MANVGMPPCPRPDDPDFKRKFKHFVMCQVQKKQQETPSPEISQSVFLPFVAQHPPPKTDESCSDESGSSTTTTGTPESIAGSSESATGSSKSVAATGDKELDAGSLEKRLCQKIDDAFAFLEERLDKEFQLLHHIITADWEGAE